MIKSKIKIIWKSGLVRNVLVVASGTAGAQAIGLVFVPFITRLYGPEAYGVLGTFIALTTILTAASALAYPVAIVLPKSDSDAKGVVKLSLIVAALISFLTFIILLLVGEWVMKKIGAIDLIDFMFFLPVVMFLVACQDVAQQWLIRKNSFSNLAKVFVAHSFFNYGVQTLAGLYTPISSVLISVYTLAITVRTALTGYIGVKVSKRTTTKSSKKLSLKSLAVEYIDFPLYQAPQIVLKAISGSLPLLMLTAFFGPASAGFYALTRTVLGLPVTLLGASVRSVFYPHFNEMVLNNNKTLPLLIKSIASLMIVGIWPFILLMFFGPYLFSLVFGSEWYQAGKYAQWLSIHIYFILVSIPVIASIPVLKLQRWLLFYEIITTIIQFVIVYIVYNVYLDELITIAVYSLAGTLITGIMIIKGCISAKKFDEGCLIN